MKQIIILLSICLLSCTKNTTEVNINVQLTSPVRKPGTVATLLNGVEKYNDQIQINGSFTQWFGFAEPGQEYKLVLNKVNKYDTGLVVVSWLDNKLLLKTDSMMFDSNSTEGIFILK